jgi:hypothetical protein
MKMWSRIIGLGVALAAAGGLAACAPGGGYADYAQWRQQQADQSAYLARRNQAAANWQAAEGNYYGAQQSQAAANEAAGEAQAQQSHADRDAFFSNLGF